MPYWPSASVRVLLQVAVEPRSSQEMTVDFSAHDPDGATRLRHAAGFIGIKSADTLNNLLGMEQLAEA